MRKKLSNLICIILTILIVLLLILFSIRLFSPKQIDDVSPGIQCNKELINKADVLFVIPKFNNNPISENKQWCQEIKSLNKTLELHGVYHNYKEFLEDKDDKYLQEGLNIFKECFNQTPNEFKPPQLAISKNNILLIKNNNLKLDLDLNQFLHKTYHCSDTGRLHNWVVDLI